MKVVKKLLPTLIVLFFVNLHLRVVGQSTADTIQNPYWIDMMQDPNINLHQTQRAFELYWQNRTIEKGCGYKPFKRWEYNMEQIADGKGNLPQPGHYESIVDAYLKTRTPSSGVGYSFGGTIGNGTATCQTTGNWVEIGPEYLPGNRTGQPNGIGRINGIAFHPTDSNIIYAGAPAGGVWITTDGGKTWSTNTDSLSTLGVSAIAVDPVNPDTIYLGTGDRDGSDSYGRGVYKSTDGGQTWVNSSTGMGNRIISQLLIDPSNHLTLIAATNGGIYRSTNGGNNWTQAFSGNMKDLVFDAVNSNILYATSTGAKVYKSTNNGSSWTQLTNGLPSSKYRAAVATTPDDSNFVYVLITNQRTYQGLYLSTNRGASFTQMSNSPNIMDYSHLGTGTGGQAWYDLDLAVHPNDKSIVTVAGVNIFQSTDSGATWKINAHWVGSGGAPAVHADNHILEYQPNTNTLYTGNDGGVYYTKNLGKSWIDISEGMGISQIYRLGQSATQKNTAINGYQDNGTGLYEQGKWYTVVGGDGMDCVIDPSDVNYAYSALYYGDVRRMKNGYSQGTIAKNGTNGITEQGGWVTPFVLREGTPSTMFIGYKNIWRSTNIQATATSGVSWTKISNNVAGSNSQNIIALENSPANSDILYVSRSGNKFFKSTNVNAASPTWTDLTSNLPNASSVLWIESHAKYQDRVWICQSNKVYQSNNGGSSWTNISSGLPNIPIISLVFDTSSKYQGMYAGTYMGVFYKDTTMSSWTWFNDNMPINTRVRDIEIYYSPNGRSQSHVICATYGRGNWRSPLYDEDQEIPVAGLEYDATKTCQGQAIQFNDTSLNLPTNWLWRFSPSTVTFVNGTDSTSQHPQVSFNSTGTYSVKMYAENCIGYDSIEINNVIEVFPPIKNPPCAPIVSNPTSTAGIGLYGFDMAGYSYSSSGSRVDGPYIDMGCTDVLDLKSDTFYIADVTTGKNYSEYVKIFIDFNNDGDLDDANELVFDTYNKTNHQDTIKIPANATSGTLLRMRVMSDYYKITDACDTLGYGQTEDYGVIFDASVPEPIFSIDTNKICQNGTVTLYDSSTGPIYKRRWYFSKYDLLTYKKDVDGPVSFTLPDTGWWYAQLVLNDSIVSKRIDSIVYVAPFPESVLSIIQASANVCEGETVRLKNTTNRTTGNFTWYKDNVKLGSLSDSIITIGNIALSDSGVYHGEIEYEGCSSVSNSQKISVSPVPNSIFTVQNVDSCLQSNSFDFVNNSTVKYGIMNYAWTFGDNSTSNASNPTRNYSDTGTYDVRLIVSTLASCYDTSYVLVSVHPNPSTNFSINNASQCFRANSFDFTNTSTIDNGTLSSQMWQFGNGDNSANANPSYSYTSPGSYVVQLITTSDKNCSDTISENIVVNPSPTAGIDVIKTDTCFANNSLDFQSNSTISNGVINTYSWVLGDGATSNLQDVINHQYPNIGNYNVSLVVESDSGCSDTAYTSVSIHPSPTADFSVNDTNPCFNNHVISFTQNSSANTSSLNAYNWDYGDGNGSTQASPANHSFTTEGTYQVQLVVRTTENCYDTADQTIIVRPSPVVNFTGGTGCVGIEIPFTNLSTSSLAPDDYTWYFGDGTSLTTTTENPNHIYNSSGIYEVKLVAQNSAGCIDSMIVKTAAEVFQKPVADFSYVKVSSFDSLTNIIFTENSTDVIIWNWQINNTPVGNSQSLDYTFQDTGSFDILVRIENNYGCADTSVQSIFIFPDAQLLVPTSFSPNSDNLNDVFLPRGVRYVKSYRLTIYNRWGNLLFETADASKSWDGTYGGSPVNTGQYVVLVETTDLNNRKLTYKGTITLVR